MHAELPEGGYVALAEYDTNPVVAIDEQRTVQLGVSGDRASWAFVRHYLGRGMRPPTALVRVEECVTAMVGVETEVDAALASPFLPGEDLLLVQDGEQLLPRRVQPAGTSEVAAAIDALKSDPRLPRDDPAQAERLALIGGLPTTYDA